MLTFYQYITEAKAKKERFDTWSWSYHPAYGIRVMSGYHRHDDIKDEYPEIYEDPDDPSHGWYPPAGFAKVDRQRRVVEFRDYESSHPDPKILEEFLKIVSAVGFKVMEPTRDTHAQRKSEDWI